MKEIILASASPRRKELLEKIGLESVLAENGIEALDHLGKEEFDAILMDCQMPEMDGFEATGVWREKEQTSSKRRLPIIAMTANVMAGDREKCLASGMDDYLGKPVRQAELGKVLQRWIK